MIKAAVTRLSPLLTLAALSCAVPKKAADRPATTPATKAAAAENAGKPGPRKVSPGAAEPAPPTPGTGRVTRIMLGDFFQLQQKNAALIFDVRPGFIYHLGHVPGAISWPKSGVDSQFALHEQELLAARKSKTPVVVYCVDLACPDARTVASRLAERGYHIAVLEGGWDAWKTGELPTE